MDIPAITKDIHDRITAAADALYEQGGRQDTPTVDAVRRASRANMSDVSTVMKEWRRLMKSTAAAPIDSVVPDRVLQANQVALIQLWGEAKDKANENLNAAQAAWEQERAEAETLRAEMAEAFEQQEAQLKGLQKAFAELEARTVAAEGQAAELRAQLAVLAERAGTAEARAIEITRRADDLNAALAAEQAAVNATAAHLDAALSELATVKTKAEAAKEQYAEHRKQAAHEAQRLAERLTKAETERHAAQRAAGEAREEAAALRGQVDALRSQNAEFMRLFSAKKEAFENQSEDRK